MNFNDNMMNSNFNQNMNYTQGNMNNININAEENTNKINRKEKTKIKNIIMNHIINMKIMSKKKLTTIKMKIKHFFIQLFCFVSEQIITKQNL